MLTEEMDVEIKMSEPRKNRKKKGDTFTTNWDVHTHTHTHVQTAVKTSR